MPARDRIIGVDELDVATQDDVESVLSDIGVVSQLHGIGEKSMHSGIMYAMDHQPVCTFSKPEPRSDEAWEE